MRGSLTKRRIEAALRVVGWRETILRDTVLPGFGARVMPGSERSPNGSVSFYYRYRTPDGRQRRAVVGHYVEGTAGDEAENAIKRARGVAERMRVAVREGRDPGDERRAERDQRRQAAADTVAAIGEQFIAKHAAQRRWGEIERIMRRDIMSAWGNRPVSNVTRRDVIELVDATVARGSPVQANRTLVVLKIFFGWCLDRDVIEADPTARVRKPTKEAARERVLSDSELAAFWRGCDRLGWPFGPLLQLLALTAQRKSEIATLRWPEIDTDRKLIELAGSRYKTGRAHVVPLAYAALAIFDALPTRDSKSGLVFTTNDKMPVSGFSKAKAELDGYMGEELGGDLAPWIIHDLRRTVRTNLSRLGVSVDIGERILGHVIPGIRGVYDQYSFLDQQRAALDRWATHLAGVVNPPPGNVVPLRPTAA